jgi:hypothetical protein
MADLVNLDINLVYLRLFSSGIGAYFFREHNNLNYYDCMILLCWTMIRCFFCWNFRISLLLLFLFRRQLLTQLKPVNFIDFQSRLSYLLAASCSTIVYYQPLNIGFSFLYRVSKEQYKNSKAHDKDFIICRTWQRPHDRVVHDNKLFVMCSLDSQ